MRYPAFQKIPRINRPYVITEKIDGTNGLIYIPGEAKVPYEAPEVDPAFDLGGIYAGSRNRWLTLDKDNFGFARWVAERAEALIPVLGPGMHYGEWWGKGIQRGYGVENKRFSLFNTARWADQQQRPDWPEDVYVVPILDRGDQGLRIFEAIENAIDTLDRHGSVAAPGFDNPEGIVVFHEASRSLFKYTLDGDGHKG